MARTKLFARLTRLIQIAHEGGHNLDFAGSAPDHSRRDFLEKLAFGSLLATSGMPMLSGCSHLPTLNYDAVVILGGGISGLTAAYFLSRAGIPCSIYESSSRLGGRMYTCGEFNFEGMTCELGGEFVDTRHHDLRNLCRELGIAVDQFSTEDQGLEQDLYYFSGQYYTDRDVARGLKNFIPQFLHDQKMSLAQIDRLSLEDYLRTIKGVDKWLIDLFRISYVGEFGLESDDQSALFFFWTFAPGRQGEDLSLFGEGDASGRIRGGNRALISALEDKLIQLGVPIFREHALVSFTAGGSDLKLTFTNGLVTKSVKARQAICTIPFSVLRNIDGIKSLDLHPLKKRLIFEMAYGTNSKLMLGYQRKIWRSGALKRHHPKIPLSTGMVYTDLVSQNLWDSSRLQAGKSGILTNFLGGATGASLDRSQAELFYKCVDQIFPGSKNTIDQNIASMNWSHYSHNLGSYSSLRPGQASEFGSCGSQTELGGRLLFAGEHAIDQTYGGFMNGACRSGRLAAEELIKNLREKTASVNSVR